MSEQVPFFESDPIFIASKPEKEYVPPVGPGSKSVPPTGDWKDLPPGFIPVMPKPPKK